MRGGYYKLFIQKKKKKKKKDDVIKIFKHTPKRSEHIHQKTLGGGGTGWMRMGAFVVQVEQSPFWMTRNGWLALIVVYINQNPLVFCARRFEYHVKLLFIKKKKGFLSLLKSIL
jgi:hypothetical protein